MPVRPYSYGSPFMRAAIIDSQGRRIPMWSAPNFLPSANTAVAYRSVGGNPLSFTSFPWVAEASVKLSLNDIPLIRVTLTPPRPVAMAFLDSPLVEWGRNLIEIQFGYTDGAPEGPQMTPIFRGVTLKPEITMGDEVTIVLNASGGFSFEVGDREKSINTTTRRKLIEYALQGYAQPGSDSIRKIRADYSAANTDPAAVALLDMPIPAYNPSGKSDWGLIYQLCAEARCWGILRPESATSGDLVLEVAPKRSKLAAAPVKTFALYDVGQRIGPQFNRYPLLSFASPTLSCFLPGSVYGIVNGGIDSSTGKPVRQVASPNDPSIARIGAGAGLPDSPNLPIPAKPTATSTTDGIRRMYRDVNEPRAQHVLNAELEDAMFHLGIKIDGESLGCPELETGEVIRVTGVGERYSHNYAILDLTHSFGGGGFSTRFSGVSNTSELDKLLAAPLAPSTNTPPPPATGPSASGSVTVAATSGRVP